MPTAKQVMDIARSQIGVKESPAGSNKTKYGSTFGMNGQPWCFIFEWWCGEQAPGANPFPHNANAAYGQDDIVSKKGGSWVMKKNKSKSARLAALKKYKAGDCVDFDFGNYDAYRRHTGLVEKVEGNYVICIEGNTSPDGSKGSQSNGGMVCRKKRYYTQICSCARPKYEAAKKYEPTTPYTGKAPALPKRGYFKQGDKGKNVGYLQDAMNWATNYGLKVDKEYGFNTAAAVSQFEYNNGLTDDGEFGKKCLEKLNALIKKHAAKTEPTETKPQETKTQETQTTTVNPTNPSFPFPERGYYKKGDKGDGVKDVQKLLNKATKGRHRDIPALVVDGIYEKKTVEAVKLLQDARHLTIDGQFGKKTLKEAQKTVTKRMMAVTWAVSIARDNSFSYGVGQRAHRGGCYFCGTNTGPVAKKKEKKGEPHFVNSKGKKWKSGDGTKYTYEKTYCCNPFAFSAYAHGAGDKKMLKKCQKGGNATTGMNPKSWKKYNFEILGKCKDYSYDKLKAGDVVMCKSHVWIYAGDGYLVEASGGNFSDSSIRHKKIAKDRYAAYKKDKTAYVVRYKG